eukprot:CAMPEP_0172531086 /NCGR_PEP_ID=MMETSP1067-20121228/4622_1 /TAXON_ID=265564 ORGANISM="Thalassiosira punctigera, Strain Tpunct2005C2" /NCGR_SAMPLE_ID=MMETSP1067 /ASSEMBLY_ACC=CAM_ASM_000444 /LENGTH=352 /DNA_ID=CAMNT_0013315419 /DNA_START=81 /DNA_END=1139 /DNA_ORIENTATION=+
MHRKQSSLAAAIVVAGLAPALASSSAGDFNLRGNDAERRLLDSIACILGGSDFISCCPSASDTDGVCTLMWCVDVDEGELRSNCSCSQVEKACTQTTPFHTVAEGLTEMCAKVDECCTDDVANEGFNSCMRTAIDSGEITLPDVAALVPGGIPSLPDVTKNETGTLESIGAATTKATEAAITTPAATTVAATTTAATTTKADTNALSMEDAEAEAPTTEAPAMKAPAYAGTDAAVDTISIETPVEPSAETVAPPAEAPVEPSVDPAAETPMVMPAAAAQPEEDLGAPANSANSTALASNSTNGTDFTSPNVNSTPPTMAPTTNSTDEPEINGASSTGATVASVIAAAVMIFA